MTDQTSPARALSEDAAAFIATLDAQTIFDGPVDPAEAERFLQSERSRLGTVLGADALDDVARAVRTTDHGLGDGVRVRVYRPDGGDEVKPVVLYLHGGGWVSGSIEQHDSTCRILACAADAVVVNVDYRLAPEHPYPAALDDCDTALAWVRAGGPDAPIDVSRIAVCGSSSGGNLAAALALRAAHRGEPVALQVLIYPALDARMAGDSYDVNGRGLFVSAGQMAWYWAAYRGSADLDDQEFSPLAASDLSAAPPAIVVTAEFDVLRDDGVRYATRLAADGVAVRRIHYPGLIHGFLMLLGIVAEASPAVQGLGRTIGRVFRGTDVADMSPRGQIA